MSVNIVNFFFVKTCSILLISKERQTPSEKKLMSTFSISPLKKKIRKESFFSNKELSKVDKKR